MPIDAQNKVHENKYSHKVHTVNGELLLNLGHVSGIYCKNKRGQTWHDVTIYFFGGASETHAIEPTAVARLKAAFVKYVEEHSQY